MIWYHDNIIERHLPGVSITWGEFLYWKLVASDGWWQILHGHKIIRGANGCKNLKDAQRMAQAVAMSLTFPDQQPQQHGS